MRLFFAFALTIILMGAAFAQTPPKPKLSLAPPSKAVTTLQAEAPTVQDFNSPDAGARWRVHPVEIGRQWLAQVQDEKHTRVLFYRSMQRMLRISIFNPSILKPAHIRVECGPRARLGSRDVGIKSIEKSEYYQLNVLPMDDGRGYASCSVVSDLPVHVAAILQERIGEHPEPGFDGSTLVQDSLTAWPAFRLVGSQ